MYIPKQNCECTEYCIDHTEYTDMHTRTQTCTYVHTSTQRARAHTHTGIRLCLTSFKQYFIYIYILVWAKKKKQMNLLTIGNFTYIWRLSFDQRCDASMPVSDWRWRQKGARTSHGWWWPCFSTASLSPWYVSVQHVSFFKSPSPLWSYHNHFSFFLSFSFSPI